MRRDGLGTRYEPLFSSTIMAKFKWRWWDALPAPLRASLVVFFLVVVLSTATFSMVPADSWGYGSFGTTFKSAPTPAPALPIAIFAEDAGLQHPGPPAPAVKFTAGADYSVIATSPDPVSPATGDTALAPSYEVEAVPVPPPTPEPALASVSPPHRKFDEAFLHLDALPLLKV